MKYEELEKLVEELKDKVGKLEEKLEEGDLTLPEKLEETDRLLKGHTHQGLETPLLYEGIATVSTVPSGTPSKRLNKQIIIYSNGTKRLYIYDFTNGAWRFASLT